MSTNFLELNLFIKINLTSKFNKIINNKLFLKGYQNLAYYIK